MNAGIRYENIVEVCIGCDVSGYVAGGAATTITKVYGPRSEVFSQNPRVLRTDYLLTFKWRWRHALGDAWWLWPLRINQPNKALLTDRDDDVRVVQWVQADGRVFDCAPKNRIERKTDD